MRVTTGEGRDGASVTLHAKMTRTATTTPDTSSQPSLSWPVQVFRFSLSKGWESCCVAADDDDSEHVVPRSCVVTAVVKRGHVEIRALRLRLSLVSGKEEEHKHRSLVIRRGDTIYWSASSKRGGGIVLRFSSEQQCLDFSDLLFKLNKNLTVDNQQDASNQQRQGDLQNYMVRLLHDDGFRGFVDDMEQSIRSSKDGDLILAALCQEK